MSRFARIQITVGVALAATLVATAAQARNELQLPLPARVLHAGDFLGLRPDGPVTVVRSADTWTGHEPPGGFFDAPLLRKDGFAGGIFEHLHWPTRNTDGLSVVVQLGSPATARKYLTMYSGMATPYPVAGIPGARGFGDQGGSNIVFADGDYAYLIGAGWQPGSPHTITRAQLLAAAKLLYHRVHGR